jgi:hypothetical protein
MGYLLITGWIVFLAMILMFNYGAHRLEKNTCFDAEIDEMKKPVRIEEEEEVIF